MSLARLVELLFDVLGTAWSRLTEGRAVIVESCGSFTPLDSSSSGRSVAGWEPVGFTRRRSGEKEGCALWLAFRIRLVIAVGTSISEERTSCERLG